MAETLEVHIQLGRDTHRVGTLYSHFRGGAESSSFTYNSDWLKNPQAFAIQPDMPLGRDGHHFSAENGSLPGSMRDGSPDRWGRKLIVRAMQKQREQAPISEVGFLISLDDTTRIGALRYRIEGSDDFLRKPSKRSIPPIITIPRLMNAADAVQKDTATAEDLGFLLGHGSPLGGARPKSAVLDKDGTLAIAKFPKADDIRNIAAGEVLSAELATRAGINTSHARLLRVEDRPVSLIRRFDRNSEGARTHFISAMTMIGAREGEDGTYTDMALAARRFSSEPTKDAHELFRRAAFNVLGTNLDDHLRNHAFLYDPGSQKWQLSPAYDMNPVPITEKPRHLTTWISEGGGEASLDNLMEVCRDFGLKPDDARGIVREVAEVTQQWRNIGRHIGLSDSDLSPYETAFQHQELKNAMSVTYATATPESLEQKKIRLQALKNQIQPDDLKNFEHAHRIDITYTSNAIEGNTLTAGETALVIEKGVTVSGKSMNDHMEALDHAKALGWTCDLSTQEGPITERDIREIHSLVVAQTRSDIAGQYATQGRYVNETGGKKDFPPPAEVPALMGQYCQWLTQAPQTPQTSFEAHRRLVNIHPFNDGNGRTSRLVMNLHLMKAGYPPVAIRPESKPEYIAALETGGKTGDYSKFDNIMDAELHKTLDQYIKAAEQALQALPRAQPSSSNSP